MRTIQRDIVGAFIFSKDGKVLLGHNKKGGVYENKLVVPGGGIDENETKIDALKREIIEEVGIDITSADILEVEGASTGESEKTLGDTGERVTVQMKFHDFKVTLPLNADEVGLRFDDDFSDARWYAINELQWDSMGPAVKATLQKLV